jgi:hypothetical protein
LTNKKSSRVYCEQLPSPNNLKAIDEWLLSRNDEEDGAVGELEEL